jgi:hypothetical protein
LALFEAFNHTFFHLEELEFGDKLLIDAFHTWEGLYDQIKVFALTNHLCEILGRQFFVKCKYLGGEIFD